MAAGKYKKPPQAPPLFTHTPEKLVAAADAMIKRSKDVQDGIVASNTPESATFKNVNLLMAQDDNEMSLESHIITFYQSVSTDATLRDASTNVEKKLDDFGIESAMREDVFKLVDAVYQKQKDDEALDVESRRLLEKDRKGYIQMGLGIPAGAKRDRFKEIKKRLSELVISFQKNLNEEQGGLWFTPAELDGVPADLMSGLKKGEGEHEGKLWLTFKYPDLHPTLRYCNNPETRRKLYIANENKVNQNVDLFREAVLLRDEAARLLGYPDHATYKIENGMAKTPKYVDDFLGDLRTRLTPGGKKEIIELKKLKQADVGNSDRYYLWDNRYYNRLMLEKDYKLDQNRISEYFPIQTTIRGMLQIFEELFGLQFVEIVGADRDAIAESGKGDDIVWHPDVQIYSVWDDEGEGSGFVGYLYLDLFPRPGKYGHAANFNIQPGFIGKDGTRRYPATALVCNFSKPTPKKPSLLKHDEVVTLFHELGHGIHDLVSKTIYSRFHGTSTVRDFVEAPSQMLENWCWTPSQLKSLSHHWSHLSPEYEAAYTETGSSAKPSKEMPDDLIDSIVRSRHVNDAVFNLRQIFFGTFDMSVHEPASHQALADMHISEAYNKLRYEVGLLDGPENDPWTFGNEQATFGHLIGGYDAGYYGYLSSQVYSADMFATVFKADPMNAKNGRRYRHTVLERGGSLDEMSVLEEFLGRKPSSEAFYQELGVA